MREPNLTILAVMGSLISTPFIVGAIVVLAIIMGLGGLFILRSGKKNPVKPPISASGTSDWQRQGQPGVGAAWNQNQQGSAAGWNQQPGSSAGWNQQPGQQQQANSWNAPDMAGQQNSWAGQQQAGANAWGAAPAQQPAWGAANAQPQQPAPAWGQNAGQPEQPQWGQNPAQPAANNSWSGINQPPQQQPWGNQNAGQAPWEATAPAPQDPWSQPQPQSQPQSGSGQQWGVAPVQQPQPPTAYGNPANPANPAWNQPQPQTQDPWGATPRPQSGSNFGSPAPAPVSQAPSWQQPQQPGQDSYGQYAANGADNDKTMLRSPGTQSGGGIGYVRVDEGKEPGRIYEIRKESLSMGRSRESDIFLEDLAVSRLHASLVNMGNGSYALKDEGSANGTKVNGQLVNKFQTYPLQEGDRVQLGQTVLVFAKK
ncbi:FHA domain-containing protein [Dictyobacter arantiisoli]|uniref:FHA domain-containing protein n=1 Tax=Dictyobacter arantiisoli TaxID=2014874 RepID=A0A5A5TBZ7_9CHLR|nr:FHA domain-containing protein [Dictyobacter arantiisoli]GCF08543.1 hypothetical protein KDI_21070 [Dictyobacter arantiisoli]